MHSFKVKIKQRGVARYTLTVIAQNSIEALRIGLSTMHTVGSVSVVKMP